MRRRQNNEVGDRIELDDMVHCIGNLKPHKAPGFDNIVGERVINGSSQLVVHITILFNSYCVHQRNVLSMFLSDNAVLASFSSLIWFLAIGSLYDLTSHELTTSKIKHSV